MPGSTLHDYVLPETQDQAVRILVTRNGIDHRVYVDPRSLAVLRVATEEAVMWWRRRPAGLLGAPVPAGHARSGPVLVAAIIALALCLPMFGLTLAAMILAERAVLGRIPATRR